jgi:hypothetical protein
MGARGRDAAREVRTFFREALANVIGGKTSKRQPNRVAG